jgi:hypothetical protein
VLVEIRLDVAQACRYLGQCKIETHKLNITIEIFTKNPE